VSDHPQYPTYPGDDGSEPTKPSQEQPLPGYGQQPLPGYGQAPPPGYGQAPPPGYGQQPPSGYGYPPPYRPTPTQAVFSLVLGVISILFCYLGVLIGPAAIVLSVVARKDIESKPPGTMSGAGLATAGLVTGIIGTVIWGAIDVLVALAVANDW
jgi:hypothetical protein